MAETPQTIEDASPARRASVLRVPGLIVIFAGTEPTIRALALEQGQLVLGRTHPDFAEDDRLSRQHVQVNFDGETWSVRDLESRNGTFVNGSAIRGEVRQTAPRVLRVGRTVCLLVPDVQPYARLAASTTLVRDNGLVVGAALGASLDTIASASTSGETLLIRGETGAGKELAARLFHSSGAFASGPFVPVNCAAIPEGVAERLLFGARKGAFSGATADANGYVQAAEGGVLFLDEIGELDLDVQAKILRLLESREVLPLGAAVPRKVRVAICLATHRDLRTEVAKGKFRADLLYRIAEMEVDLPALRDRPEEIPWLVARELRRVDSRLVADARLVEACLLRPWPGNVRELVGAARRAAHAALARSDTTVALEDMETTAGMALGIAEASVQRSSSAPAPSREAIEEALAAHGGNISGAARALSLHRTQFCRYMKRYGIE